VLIKESRGKEDGRKNKNKTIMMKNGGDRRT
jgi:hypothetical protein